MQPFTKTFCALALSALAISTTASAAETHIFNLYILGFRAGTISTAINKKGQNYALAGKVQPTAFLRRLRDIGYTGTVYGRFGKGHKYSPSRYIGNMRTGTRTSTVKMHWTKGRPVVDSYEPSRPPRPYDIKPGAQKNTMDLLSSLHSVFEDSTKADLCGRTIPMFDGRRRTKLVLSEPRFSGLKGTCNGTYTRVAGFSPEDMKERVNFPFKLLYELQDDGNYRLKSLSTTTTFGKASLVRR
jgi:hypothetical protein